MSGGFVIAPPKGLSYFSPFFIRRNEIKLRSPAIIFYVLKRLLLLIPLLLGITVLTFSLTKALPGDPVLGLIGERASPEAIERIRARLGSDKGALLQYSGYIGLLMEGEFGRSYYTNRKVMEEIIEKFPNTMVLALGAMIIAIPLGVLLGFTAAYRRGSWIDRLITTVSVLGISMPVFWIGLLLMLLVSFKLRLLPPSGTGDIRFLVLPAVTLALPAVATLARVSRTSVIDVLHMPFLQSVKAKGITGLRTTFAHVLKNAMIPIVTVVGLDFGSYLNGAVLTETIFGWDGIGRYALEGIIKRDYPVVMGTIIVGTLAFVLINLLVDIAYHFLDPRVRLGEKGRVS
jgi:ABC-type dipeptide/oligopeptide/nickel transport system permease component